MAQGSVPSGQGRPGRLVGAQRGAGVELPGRRPGQLRSWVARRSGGDGLGAGGGGRSAGVAGVPSPRGQGSWRPRPGSGSFSTSAAGSRRRATRTRWPRRWTRLAGSSTSTTTPSCSRTRAPGSARRPRARPATSTRTPATPPRSSPAPGATLDFDMPVGVIMIDILNFLEDAGDVLVPAGRGRPRRQLPGRPCSRRGTSG